MNLVELKRSLNTLRLGGMAETVENRILEAQTDKCPLDFASALVPTSSPGAATASSSAASSRPQFRDTNKTLDAFDFDFNKKMNRRLLFELATGQFVERHEDALFLGPPGTGKSHIAQAIGRAVIKAQGHRVLYREAHRSSRTSPTPPSAASARPSSRAHQVPLLIIDDLGMRKLPATAAEDLLELVMRRYERTSTLITSNRPVEDWGKLLGDTAAVAAILDRLLHHAHVLKFGPTQLAHQDHVRLEVHRPPRVASTRLGLSRWPVLK